MSNSNAQARATKVREYRQQRRAAQKLETRQRIAEATLELHSTLGPAQTSIAQIAERAGVQRHTVYAHFPDERSLFMACSGLAMERDPLPDPENWLGIPAGEQRIAAGLADLYGWFSRNAGQSACVLRDAEHHAMTRETVELVMAPTFLKAAAILSDGLSPDRQAVLSVAMSFYSWRTLAETRSPEEAAALMARAIVAA